MDTRDLARVDPWRQSLERSQARRETSRRPSASPRPQRPERAARPERPARPKRAARPTRAARPRVHAAETSDRPRHAWPGRVRRWIERAGGLLSLMPRLGPRSVAGLALLSAIVASDLAGGSQASTTRAAARIPARLASTKSSLAGPGLAAAGVAGWRSCPLAVTPGGYVNPLAGAVVKPERVDQGVDYAGSGTLEAIGAGRITYLATSNTGWPGAFIEYQLTVGADAGCYVYYAEGVIPAPGLAVGETVTGGQTLATIIPKYPTGIELGWGSGKSTKAYAKIAGQWSPTDDQDNVATAAGKSFSSLIQTLGGPPGKVEG